MFTCSSGGTGAVSVVGVESDTDPYADSDAVSDAVSEADRSIVFEIPSLDRCLT